MGNPETLSTEAQRKKQGTAISANVNDAEGNELLIDILSALEKIEFHLSVMNNTVIKGKVK